jgi:hypothetical protein
MKGTIACIAVVLIFMTCSFGHRKQNVRQTGLVDAHGASWRYPESTCAGLPTAAARDTRWRHTATGRLTSACTTGGGSVRADLRSTGSAWVVISGGGDRAAVAIDVLRGGTFGAGHNIPYWGGSGSGIDARSAWSGNPPSAIDQSAGAGKVFTIQPESITPTISNELVFAVLSDQAHPADRTHSVDASMTEPDNIASADSRYKGMIAYKIQTAASAMNPIFTATGTAKKSAATIVSFKSTSSTSGGEIGHRIIGGY